MSPSLKWIALFVVLALHTAYARDADCVCSGCADCDGFTSMCSTFGGDSTCIGSVGACQNMPNADCDTFSDDCATACATVCSTGVGECQPSSKCFPADATVTLESGAVKTMAQLAIGDRVLVGKNSFSEVYMFSHRNIDADSSFVQVAAENNTTLRLTLDHYLYVNGKLATAKTVTPGDQLLAANGDAIKVLSVSAVRASGLYNPHTLHGDIVVDGVCTSTYTASIAPALAHAALWPVRMAYALGHGLDADSFAEGSEVLAGMLPDGKDKY